MASSDYEELASMQSSLPTSFMYKHFYVRDNGHMLCLYSRMGMHYNWLYHRWEGHFNIEHHYMEITKSNIYVPFFYGDIAIEIMKGTVCL